MELIGSFILQDNPIAETIEVEVNGVVMTEGWSYNEQSNAIVFLEGHIPAEGSAILVNYEVSL